MNIPIKDKLFEDIPRRVASFAKIGPGTLKNRWTEKKLEMWANAQRDGRPAEYRWRPLFDAAKLG